MTTFYRLSLVDGSDRVNWAWDGLHYVRSGWLTLNKPDGIVIPVSQCGNVNRANVMFITTWL